MYCQFCGRPVIPGQACQLTDCPSRQPVHLQNQFNSNLRPPAPPLPVKKKGGSAIQALGAGFGLIILSFIVIGLATSSSTATNPSSQSNPAPAQSVNQVDQALINEVRAVASDYKDINDQLEIYINTCDDAGFARLDPIMIEFTGRMEAHTPRIQATNEATKAVARETLLPAINVEIIRGEALAERLAVECL